MNKTAKKQMIGLLFIVIMFGSTLAFAFFSNFDEPVEQVEPEIKYLIDGYLPLEQSDFYLQRGFTIIEFHSYDGCCSDIKEYINTLPDNPVFKNQGQTQVIVQNILNEETRSEGSFMKARSAYATKKQTIKQTSDVFSLLCKVLSAPPVDCALLSINWSDTTVEDLTGNPLNSTNITEEAILNQTNSSS